VNVLIDTSVWSEVLRRSQGGDTACVADVRALLDESRVVMIGPIRQELLSGIQREEQFTALREALSAFPDHMVTTHDYEEAAVCFNKCCASGLQASNTDFLICAVALRNKFKIFTTDADFDRFKNVLPIELYRQRFFCDK